MTERTTDPTTESRTAEHRGGSGVQPAGSGRMGGAAPELLVDEVTTREALEGLRNDWHQLLDRCPWATPFQSPDWLLPWWRAIGRGELCVTTLRRGGRLVGLAPLFIYCGPDGRRRLAMLGAGVSDYEDVLLEPELADAGAALLLQHIAEERSRWDAGEFFELRAASPLLAAPWPRELSVDRYPSSSCTVLPLPRAADALPGSLSWRFRRRLRNARNRLTRAGDAQFVTADEESLPELLGALVRLHTLRWEERGEPGVLSDPRLRRFHEAAAAGLLRRGRLRLHALRLRGAPVAVLYGFAHRDRVCMYLSGLDPATDFCSPGVLILHYAIEQAIEEGAREFDMLRGTESYKYDWSAESRPNAGLRLRHAGAAGDAPAR
jgi:CelD/BcsL family acetyltransferase involved in cellulose biosynthesis